MTWYEVLSEKSISIVGHILDWMASEWLCGGCADPIPCPISSRNPARITPPNQSILVEEEEEKNDLL